MTIYGSILPGAITIARSAALTDKLTERAKFKIKVLDWHREHGNNVSLTARHFGLGRASVHRWIKRLKHYGPIGLNEKSRKPKRTRKPITSWDIVIRTVQLRKQYPAWSKYKLKVLLERESIQTSVSAVGRILKRRNLIDKIVSRKRKYSCIKA